MKPTDVISKYLEALRTNMPDDQAQLFAKSWAESMELHPEAATKADLRELKTEIMSHFRIVYALGAAIFAVNCIPILEKILAK